MSPVSSPRSRAGPARLQVISPSKPSLVRPSASTTLATTWARLDRPGEKAVRSDSSRSRLRRTRGTKDIDCDGGSAGDADDPELTGFVADVPAQCAI